MTNIVEIYFITLLQVVRPQYTGEVGNVAISGVKFSQDAVAV